MDDPIFLYRSRSDDRFYDASSQQMRGGPDKVIVYLDGVLCAMDREAKITIPVSRWKLAELGLACFMTALRVKGAAPRPLESGPEPFVLPPEVLAEPPEGATEQRTPEALWDRLMKEMRDLSR